MASLVEQVKQKLATRDKLQARDKRCWPSCPREHWHDHNPARGLILTTCGVCGTFVGYRPVEDKQAANMNHDDTKEVANV